MEKLARSSTVESSYRRSLACAAGYLNPKTALVPNPQPPVPPNALVLTAWVSYSPAALGVRDYAQSELPSEAPVMLARLVAALAMLSLTTASLAQSKTAAARPQTKNVWLTAGEASRDRYADTSAATSRPASPPPADQGSQRSPPPATGPIAAPLRNVNDGPAKPLAKV